MNVADSVISALIGVRAGAGMAAARLLPGPDLRRRLADFPTGPAPVARPVTIHWNRHAIPFIEAATDGDAAVALGMVHAHLRLAQMETMRLLAHGRVAEMLGPAALPLDHGLRLLDFPRAVPRILAGLPGWTRMWVESFAAGIGHYAAHTPRLPPDHQALGLGRNPWSAADVLAVGRLASADVNWVILFNLLRLRTRQDWPALWSRLMECEGASPTPAMEDGNPLGAVATGITRAGSNALAVAGWRSASGAALMAADPHLSLTLPNLWLVAGVKCPSLHVAGLMIPGLPFVAIGRNPVAAWSGTSLQAASSELFDARHLPARCRTATLRARWGGESAAELRDTRLGPVITDSPLVTAPGPVALHWMGHRPSDELSAWLGVARATDWQSFAAAADGMAVPGQTLIYADAGGRIGKLLAARLPRRPPGPAADAVLPPDGAEAAWAQPLSAAALPGLVDPPGGVVASANERPSHAPVRVGLFFPGHDRYLRLHRLARGRARLDLDELAGWQQDVFSESALDLKGWLTRHLPPHPLAATLEQWDGTYGEASRGAAALELLLDHLHHAAGGGGMEGYWASWNPNAVMRRRLDGLEPDALSRLLSASADSVGAEPPQWGELHRLRLTHALGLLPGLGRLCRFVDLPSGGGNDTLHKTAHGLAGGGRHPARFGANARFLADLADPDSTRIVVLGGQDGWPGSTTFLDQVPLWRRGEAIPLPLRPETVRATFPHRIELRP